MTELEQVLMRKISEMKNEISIHKGLMDTKLEELRAMINELAEKRGLTNESQTD